MCVSCFYISMQRLRCLCYGCRSTSQRTGTGMLTSVVKPLVGEDADLDYLLMSLVVILGSVLEQIESRSRVPRVSDLRVRHPCACTADTMVRSACVYRTRARPGSDVASITPYKSPIIPSHS